MVQDETLLKVANRDMIGVVPLYYEMSKAKDSLITSDKLYEALTSAYKANIGIISNEITKIWNTENPNIEAVKWLCLLNNFTIDFAKTLYMPEKPLHIDEQLKVFSKIKLPHFFKFAKDKSDSQIEKLNNSTVNKLYNIVPNKPIQFKKLFGNVDHKLLMNNEYPNHNKDKNDIVIQEFIRLNKMKNIFTNQDGYDESGFNKFVRDSMKEVFKNENYISDILVEHFFNTDSAYKKTLWACYGEFIHSNLLIKLQGSFNCEDCGLRFSGKKNQILCDECKVIRKKEQNKIADKKYREKLKR